LTYQRAKNWKELREQVEIIDENLLNVEKYAFGQLRSDLDNATEGVALFRKDQFAHTTEVLMLKARLDVVLARVFNQIEMPLQMVRDNVTSLQKRVLNLERAR